MRLASSLSLVLMACAAQPPQPPQPSPPDPPVQIDHDDCDVIPSSFTVTIDNAYMAEDCLDPQGFTRETIKVGRKSRPCYQSQVLLTITGGRYERLEVVAARVLDAATWRLAGTIKLREPGIWSPESSAYLPWTWNMEIRTTPLYARFAMGEPDFEGAAERVGATWSPNGPFMLELDLKIARQTMTIRSHYFPKYQPDANDR